MNEQLQNQTKQTLQSSLLHGRNAHHHHSTPSPVQAVGKGLAETTTALSATQGTSFGTLTEAN